MHVTGYMHVTGHIPNVYCKLFLLGVVYFCSDLFNDQGMTTKVYYEIVARNCIAFACMYYFIFGVTVAKDCLLHDFKSAINKERKQM